MLAASDVRRILSIDLVKFFPLYHIGDSLRYKFHIYA